MKQIKAPFMFDCEDGVALQAMQGNRALYLARGSFKYFLELGRNLEYILEFLRGWTFRTSVCSGMTRLLPSYEGNVRKLQEAWQVITDVPRGEVGD